MALHTNIKEGLVGPGADSGREGRLGGAGWTEKRNGLYAVLDGAQCITFTERLWYLSDKKRCDPLFSLHACIVQVTGRIHLPRLFVKYFS